MRAWYCVVVVRMEPRLVVLIPVGTSFYECRDKIVIYLRVLERWIPQAPEDREVG